jgi:hypothetical protein
MSMVPPSMLAEIDKCLRVARWTSLALVAAIVAQGKVLPRCVRLPSVPLAVARVCTLSVMTTAQHVDDLMLTTQRARERIR